MTMMTIARIVSLVLVILCTFYFVNVQTADHPPAAVMSR